jgi:hypothetical protein
MTPTEIQLLVSLLTITGSGISVYVGVKVAIAEIRGDITRHEMQINSLQSRVDRLEKPYFKEDE